MDRLPALDALTKLSQMGFSTFVFRVPADDDAARLLLNRFQAFAAGAGRGLVRPIAESGNLYAFEFVERAAPENAASTGSEPKRGDALLQ